MALAVLDLSFQPSAPPAIEINAGKLVFTASEPTLIFYKDMVSVGTDTTQTTVLVGQNYFDPSDRYSQHKGVQTDKFITTFEFLRQKVYGCQVVVTNVSSSLQQLDVLLQIPQGAVPVSNGFTLSSQAVRLQPYSTHKIEVCL